MSEQPTAAGAVFVVKDPLNGEFFRFQETERFIAGQLDGATPLETVRERVTERFGAPLAPATLSAFVTSLDQAGLLESAAPAARRSRRKHRGRRWRGGLLYLRLRLLDPDRLLAWLLDKVRFCFTPHFVLCSGMLMLLAAGVLALHWGEVTQAFGGLLRFSALPLVVAVVFLGVSAHELAHGLTCKHFGGEVREMGFMLLYFQPAFYCNVSDAWLFPEKSKRLWVGLAGPWMELFLWAVATVLWWLTDAGTAVNQLAFILMAGSGVKTLLNFNPLIKLDGYYLLSDWLDIPNLRMKSFRYVGDRLKRLCGFDVLEAGNVSDRERRIYLAYGLTATVFSVLLLGWVAVKAGGFLIQQHQPLALLLLSGLLATGFGRRFLKMFGGSSNASGDPDDPNETETRGDAPDAAQPQKPPKPGKKKRSAQRRLVRLANRLLKLGVLGGATAAVLLFGRMELRIAGDLHVLPVHNADVRAPVEGIIEEICVAEGDLVQQGDLIARLSDRAVRAELQKLEAQIEESRARLKLLEAGARPQEIELAQVAITRADEQLKFKRDRLERDRLLYAQQLLSQNEYEESARQVASLESDLAEARRKLDILLAGTRPEEIEAVKAQTASLETQRAYLEDQLRRGSVESPAAGIVTTPSRQLKELKHQFVGKGDLIAKVHDFKRITAEIAVSEKEIAGVRTGRPVALKVRAYPDLIFHGQITGIATTARGAAAASPMAASRTGPGVSSPAGAGTAASTILVTTEIDNRAGLLKPGMTGTAKIYCGERRLIDLVLRRLSLMLKVEFWSWW